MIQVLRNVRELYQCKSAGSQGDVHPILNGALVWEGNRILWVGSDDAIPEIYSAQECLDARGTIVVPGLIDCHTHLAFGGWRADDFEKRVLGKSYLEIAKSGGGILSTVKHTRETSEEELARKCLTFLQDIASTGVTTIECKSGYGLTLHDELKILRVYEALTEDQPLTIVPTFLGAHTVPTEFQSKRQEYIKLLKEEMLPQIATERLATFCDVFVEDTAFTRDEARQILEEGIKHGLKPKLHADQLSDGGGAELAAEVGAISADHLECISDRGIAALRENDVVAVTLPIASLYTHQSALDARRLIDAEVPVAVATDFNPGSAPSHHLPFAMTLACNLNRMTPSEVLKGVTHYAAHAVGLENHCGSLEHGKWADFAVIDAPSVNHWMYQFRANACVATVKGGHVIAGSL